MEQMSFTKKKKVGAEKRVEVEGDRFYSVHPMVHGFLDVEHSLAVIGVDAEYYVGEFLQEIMDVTGMQGIAIEIPTGANAYCACWTNMCQDVDNSGLPFGQDKNNPFGSDTMAASSYPYKFAAPGQLRVATSVRALNAIGANRGVYIIKLDAGSYRLLEVRDHPILMAGDLLVEEEKVLEYKLVYGVVD